MVVEELLGNLELGKLIKTAHEMMSARQVDMLVCKVLAMVELELLAW